MSLNNQILLCSKYSDDNNIKISNIIKDIIPGHDITLTKLYYFLNNSYNINIIIADPSRLTRNISQFDNILKICNNNNIILHFVRNNLKTSINNDIKKIKICISNAYTETKILSMRIKSIVNMKKNLGSYYGRVPFGYTKYNYIDKKTKIKIYKLKKNIVEQTTIKIILKLYKGFKINNFKIKKNKYSINEIANILNNKKKYLNKNKKWNYHTIRNIIKNNI